MLTHQDHLAESHSVKRWTTKTEKLWGIFILQILKISPSSNIQKPVFFIILSDLVTKLSPSDSRLVSLSLVDKPTKRGIYGGLAVNMWSVLHFNCNLRYPGHLRLTELDMHTLGSISCHALHYTSLGTHWKVSCATPSDRQVRDRICSQHDITATNLKGCPLVQHLQAWVHCLAQNHSALDFKKGHGLD